MDIETYLVHLKDIQDRLLSMPEEEALTASFTTEQTHLEEALQRLATFKEEEREKAKVVIEEFSKKLAERVSSLKNRLQQISGEMAQQEIRIKGARAYGAKQKIL